MLKIFKSDAGFSNHKANMDICLHLRLILMDKVFDGYIIPWHNAKAPKDIKDLSMVYSLVYRYKQTASI